jgi:hypothetical protein
MNNHCHSITASALQHHCITASQPKAPIPSFLRALILCAAALHYCITVSLHNSITTKGSNPLVPQGFDPLRGCTALLYYSITASQQNKLNQSGKPHKSQCQNAGYYKGNGSAAHSFGNIHQVEMLADTGKKYQRKRKTY